MRFFFYSSFICFAVIDGYMFVSCSTLGSFTMSHNITTIGEHCFNYCMALETITYEGSLADWAAITKHTNWDGKGGSGIAISGLTRIQCLDGFMEWDDENHSVFERFKAEILYDMQGAKTSIMDIFTKLSAVEETLSGVEEALADIVEVTT